MSESRRDIADDAFGELSQFKKQCPDGDPTPPEKASHLIWTGPKPSRILRSFPVEAICLSKILNAVEFSRLFFDVYDAIILADNPKLVEIPLGNFSMEFMVFDEGYRPYNMTLSPFERRGDRVGFYKFLDSHISNSYYYVVLKLPADVDCLNRRNPVTPGSRPLMPESHCFSKELLWNDVAPGKAGLRLEASQARHFVSSSRSLNKPFMVYDEADSLYDLKLSFFIMCGQVSLYYLDNVGWGKFVKQNNLKRGDTIDVYKERPLMPESHCFSKELLWNDVAPGKAGLRLEASQARHFVSSSRSLNEPFMVYDEADRLYDLKLSFFIIRGQVSLYYLDNVGWGKFVKQNNLKRGDTIDVYKVLDQSVCNDHYFVISYKSARNGKRNK
ncbi:hypothetical protein CASFOL_005671 [Castilleja foliolosa]|uniref:TF-B3 domain-containing protein n=1 Tax=Castilleja foliolosa TaxID=1961234 RepID=A0ABD3E443_9LAMI